MQTASERLGETLWQASQQLYAAPGIETWCLQAQQAGANINLLLLLALQAARQACCDLDGLLHALDSSEPVLTAWRPLRQQLKSQLASADNQALKQHELALEHWQQQTLIATALAVPATMPAGEALTTYVASLADPALASGLPALQAAADTLFIAYGAPAAC